MYPPVVEMRRNVHKSAENDGKPMNGFSQALILKFGRLVMKQLQNLDDPGVSIQNISPVPPKSSGVFPPWKWSNIKKFWDVYWSP